MVCVLFCDQNGGAAASLSVAEQYVAAFSNLAKQTNTLLLPSNTSDITGMVTQVQCSGLRACVLQIMCIYLHTGDHCLDCVSKCDGNL